MSIVILGIESSCDDTSAAVLKDGKILANLTANQKVHQAYGGVVPELASRAHQANIVPVVDQAIKMAGIEKKDINAVAFTQGPGLIGSLLVGGMFSKAFSMALDIPLMSVHHMKAHVLAHFIDDPKPPFPFLCLTVSGGHTQIVLVKDYLNMEVIGHTIDDAAGEAFDKTGKLIGLDYPAGPIIDKYARDGDPSRYSFAIPRIPGLNFSFSGIKTSVKYFLQDETAKADDFVQSNLNDICASVQSCIVAHLMAKLRRASRETGIKEIAIAGGVSANSGLRKEVIRIGKKEKWNHYFPKVEYCTDNAAMIAMAGYYQFLNNDFAGQETAVKARMKF